MTRRFELRDFRDVPLDDNAMERHARELAVSADWSGAARLSAVKLRAADMRRIFSTAGRLAASADALTPSMEWLADNGRLMEAFAAPLSSLPKCRLPAHPGGIRIMELMRELVMHSDAGISPGRLVSSIRSFDEVRALTMDELWAAPAALRLALVDAYSAVAHRAIYSQRQWMAAEKWVAGGADPRFMPPGASRPFLERALQLMHEQDMPAARNELERRIALSDESAQSLIQSEHERQAIERMWLGNIIQTLRMLDAIRWDIEFSGLSRTEAELNRDPSGTYPEMDDESRSVVRERVALMARRTGMGETTIARQAVMAAGESKGRQREVCWWLYDDDGISELNKRMGMQGARRELTPDPRGHAYICAICALTFGLILFAAALGLDIWMLIVAFPILLGVGAAIANAAAGGRKPAKLLKMRFEQIPDDARTLVVMPVLISDEQRGVELASQLEALGCLEDDRNIEYLLLGDFSDSSSEVCEGDGRIISATSEYLHAANERAGRVKYRLLYRRRAFSEREGKYMARDRKRGALGALNTLIMGGENEFADPGAPAAFAGRFAYVVTLDAGTRMIPGTVKKMVGAIAHPLNRLCVEKKIKKGYAVLQPRMELPADAVTNRFVGLFGGAGGVDSYPTCVSDVYQDMCGRGIFGGKGIYHVESFHAALDGKLPPERILSHDLIEGLISGAGFLGDVTLYEGHPRTVGAYFKRLHRWTRGDWQLLPVLIKSYKYSLGALGRHKVADNLRRSLTPACQLALIIAGFYTESVPAVLVGLLPFITPMLQSLFRLRRGDFERLFLRIALLPAEAYVLIDAIARTLWRITVSKKRLLEWVTADDADRAGGGVPRWPGVLAAAALLYPAIDPLWSVPAVILIFLWLISPHWAAVLARPRPALPELTDAQRDIQLGLARKTWRFFERQVPDNGLPPDNVQLEPPTGAAHRTSPTNIGLYLLSCLSARELDMIGDEEMNLRMSATISTVEMLDKWRGQLYNWYDTQSCRPLSPRYVSSVDGGNLAACLLLVANAPTVNYELKRRMEALARAMDFTALYDEPRRLFVIGMDVDNNRVSDSRYDLLASESRILSFAAMMLGQVPADHWRHLGRAQAAVGGGQALMSWSGTMFEYLMPEIFMPALPGTLLEQTRRSVIRAQKARQMDLGGAVMPWGVSESGYYAFDLKLNYQYRAFGLPELALRGGEADKVIAPYASLLALPFDPCGVTDNVLRMQGMGLQSGDGLFEAVDLSRERLPEGTEFKIIYSHMAHHQGMILASQANALKGGILAQYFMQRSEARALSLLLQEKPATRLRLKKRMIISEQVGDKLSSGPRLLRSVDPAGGVAEGHLLFGGGSTFFSTATGEGFMKKDGVLAGRRSLELGSMRQGHFTHMRNLTSGADCVLSGQSVCPAWLTQRAHFDAGQMSWVSRTGQVEAKLSVCLSPEDGSLIRKVALTNLTASPLAIEITDCFAVALASEVDYTAHPAFQNLFVESSRPALCALAFRRRPRFDGAELPELMHVVSGDCDGGISCETDLERLVGRSGLMGAPGGIADELAGSTGNVLNPCSALRARVYIKPDARAEISFAVGFCAPNEGTKFIERHSSADAAARAFELAGTQARAMLRYLSITPRAHYMFQRASVLVTYPAPKPHPPGEPPSDLGLSMGELWALGISGELPIFVCSASKTEHLKGVREVMRMHEFYRSMGLWCDLVLINEYGNDYDQPVRDGLNAMISASHLCGLRGCAGGVFMLEGSALTSRQSALLRRCAAIYMGGGVQLYDGLKDLVARVPTVLCESDGDRSSGQSVLPEHGFTADGGYRILLEPGSNTPAPWMNIFANPSFGSMVSERGGGYIWHRNSRNERLTPFENDPLNEGFGDVMYIVDPRTGASTPLVPTHGERACAYEVIHHQGYSEFLGRRDRYKWRLVQFIDANRPIKYQVAEIENCGREGLGLTISARIDWLMGVSRDDRKYLQTGFAGGISWAAGSCGDIGFSAFAGNPDTRPGERGELCVGANISAGNTLTIPLIIGCAPDVEGALNTLRDLEESGGWRARFDECVSGWDQRLNCIAVATPDESVNIMVNRWLPYQSLAGRVWGRAGFYQAGGAFGFRDQLQDMLPLINVDPGMVRGHIINCARHQFADGDVQHWWHPERTGVRTRITDDMLFLPYVTSIYVLETGDKSILSEAAPFLENVEIPEGREDWYGEPLVSEESGTIHEHCLRAIARALKFGKHGLSLMGGGDWNDGMNRVGHKGLGESVWLSEFLVVTLESYAELCDGETAAGLREQAIIVRANIEKHGWDGGWYLRAYSDGGRMIGSASSPEGQGCRIDAIAQCWAVMAGLDRDRARQAMDSVIDNLVDREHGIVKLLTPPFRREVGDGFDPGYISSYPPGVRENGGQYTHAACWTVMALAELGDADAAWNIYRMILPPSHASTPEDTERYKVEPYVVAADVYGEPPHSGRGGWTWYTGSAGWMVRVAYRYLMGYERRGSRVRLSALLPAGWNEVSVTVIVGGSKYTLISRREQDGVTFDGEPREGEYVELVDDGRDHICAFPAREPSKILALA